MSLQPSIGFVAFLGIVGVMTATTAAGKDFDAAQFVQNRCTQCHDSRVYTRPDRRVTSLERLNAQVRMCDANLGTKLFDEDIAAIVRHLNENYYKFK